MVIILSEEKNDMLDQLIKEAIHEEMEQTPSPMYSAGEAWKKLEGVRNKQSVQRPRSFRKVWMYAASVLVILASATLFSTSQGFASPTLTQFFQEVQGKMLHLFVKVGEDTGFGNPPPGDSGSGRVLETSEIKSMQMSLQEARKETAFSIAVPTVIPKAYHLGDVTVMKEDGELGNEIYLHYEGADDEDFLVNQREVGEAFGMGIALDNENAHVEQMVINGQQAQLLTTYDDFRELFWIKDDQMYYSISGNLSKQEIIEMAESME